MVMPNENEDEVYEWSDLRPCPGDILLLVGGPTSFSPQKIRKNDTRDFILL